jgi:hypothetical protein
MIQEVLGVDIDAVIVIDMHIAKSFKHLCAFIIIKAVAFKKGVALFRLDLTSAGLYLPDGVNFFSS